MSAGAGQAGEGNECPDGGVRVKSGTMAEHEASVDGDMCPRGGEAPLWTVRFVLSLEATSARQWTDTLRSDAQMLLAEGDGTFGPVRAPRLVGAPVNEAKGLVVLDQGMVSACFGDALARELRKLPDFAENDAGRKLVMRGHGVSLVKCLDYWLGDGCIRLFAWCLGLDHWRSRWVILSRLADFMLVDPSAAVKLFDFLMKFNGEGVEEACTAPFDQEDVMPRYQEEGAGPELEQAGSSPPTQEEGFGGDFGDGDYEMVGFPKPTEGHQGGHRAATAAEDGLEAPGPLRAMDTLFGRLQLGVDCSGSATGGMPGQDDGARPSFGIRRYGIVIPLGLSCALGVPGGLDERGGLGLTVGGGSQPCKRTRGEVGGFVEEVKVPEAKLEAPADSEKALEAGAGRRLRLGSRCGRGCEKPAAEAKNAVGWTSPRGPVSCFLWKRASGTRPASFNVCCRPRLVCEALLSFFKEACESKIEPV